jgi:heme/copper-type cytochrome/quinol oxidase subunit 2
MELSTEMFMILVLVIGIILSIYAFKIDSSIATECENEDKSKALTRSSRGLIVLSISMVSSAVTYLLGGCSSASSSNVIGIIFLSLMIGLGIVVTVLSSIIHVKCDEADKDKTNHVKKDATTLIVLGVLSTLMSSAYMFYQLKDKIKM